MTASRALVIVAHPDDETIFLGGTTRRLVTAGLRVDVACVTSVFATAALTSVRREEFRRACWALGTKARLLPMVDTEGRLDEADLHAALEREVRWAQYDLVVTHGVWGEYGHPHHMQVSRAVHSLATTAVFSLAGPFLTRGRHRLGPLMIAAKRSVAATAYRSQPFAANWCTEEERFVRWPVGDACYLSGVGLGDPVAVVPGRTGLHVCEDVYPDVEHIPVALWRPGHSARYRQLHTDLAALTREPARR